MLTKRVIPCLDIRDGRVVKGVNFVDLVDVGDPVKNAMFYDEEGADELVFLDISATPQGRETLVDLVEEIASHIRIPFAVGGGVRSLDDVRRLTERGADKVCINSEAVEDPGLITQASHLFGSQCLVAAIDAKRCGKSWKVFIHGGQKETHLDALKWAREVEHRGAGEILLTSMDRDGTKKGYDLELTSRISQMVSIPVIASGGAGLSDHLYQGLLEGKADAVLAASIFHFRKCSIREVKEVLSQRGIPVRM